MRRFLNAPVFNSPYGVRSFALFVDPFGSKDPQLSAVDSSDLHERNRLVGYSKMIGDPEKGLADDTRVHPFGDLRIHLARFNSSNLCFWWEYDFTGGRIVNNGQNALLSNEARNRIYTQHKRSPNEWTVERLAEKYRIRQQRVMAILSLKQLAETEMAISESQREKHKGPEPPEFSYIESDPPAKTDDVVDEASDEATEKLKRAKKQISDEDWYKLCDWAGEFSLSKPSKVIGCCLESFVFGATAEEGAGERHFVSVPTFPKFEAIPLTEASKYSSTEWNISRVNRLYTAKEDKFQIREFKERLYLNTGQLGTTLDFKTDRTQMHRSPPKERTPILVTSLDADMKRPYVAEPDGSQRRLTPDEFLIWKRKNREAFTKLVEKQIQREGKRNENADL